MGEYCGREKIYQILLFSVIKKLPSEIVFLAGQASHKIPNYTFQVKTCSWLQSERERYQNCIFIFNVVVSMLSTWKFFISEF